MQEFIVLVLSAAVGGAVVAGVTNKVQGDDVLKSVKGGLAGGIATAFMTLLTNFLLHSMLGVA